MLRAIGRRHTAGEIETAMGLVAEYGFPHVNMDLIAGLPEDTEAGFRRSSGAVPGLRHRQHHRPHPGAEKGQPDPAGGAGGARRRGGVRHAGLRGERPSGAPATGPTTSTGRSTCPAALKTSAGARPGGVCWYNVYIMSELCSILSFGAGGSTKMVVPGTNRIHRVFNLKYPKEYTERPEKALANLEAFASFYEHL